MAQNNLSYSTEEVLYRLLRHVIYDRADTFRRNPNYLKDFSKLTLEKRVAQRKNGVNSVIITLQSMFRF